MKNRRRIFWIIPIVAVFAAAAIGGSYLLARNARAVAEPGDVFVPTGAGYQTLLDSLGADGQRIKNMARFDRIARLNGLHKRVHPGRYRLKSDMSYRSVVRMFRQGLQTPVRVTFNNVRTLGNLAGSVSRQLEPDSLTMFGVLSADSTAAAYGFTPRTFMAMFIPDTYELYWNTPPEGFVKRMNREYERFWTPERIEKLEKTGLSRVEAMTLASIVYEETKMSDEMAVVAGVYMNRLRIGMPLQADPTVKFAVGDFTLRRVLNRHLEVDSPYNTYMYSGLPPGPIAMPSIRAIDAVLGYKSHNYLYFCAKSDFSGYHVFAATFAEHSRNAQAYARALNERQIFR